MKTDTSVVFSLLLPLFYTVSQSPYPYCFPTVPSLYPHCTPTITPLYPHCTPTVTSLYPHYPHYIQIYPVLHCDQTVRNPPVGVLAMKSIHRKTTFITIYFRPSLYPHCTLNVPPLYPDYTPTILTISKYTPFYTVIKQFETLQREFWQ